MTQDKFISGQSTDLSWKISIMIRTSTSSPNIIPLRMFRDHQDFRLPTLGFFTWRDIDVGEELGFNYEACFWNINVKARMKNGNAEKVHVNYLQELKKKHCLTFRNCFNHFYVFSRWISPIEFPISFTKKDTKWKGIWSIRGILRW